MADDLDLAVILSATYAQYQEAMQAVESTTERAAAGVAASMEAMGASMEQVEAQAQALREIPIIYAQGAAAMEGEAAAAITVEEALGQLTVAEREAAGAAAARAKATQEAIAASMEAAAASEAEGDAAEVTATKMGMVEKMAMRMILRMALLLAIVGTFNEIKKAMQEVAEENKGLDQTTFLLEQFGTATQADEPMLRAFTDKLKDQGVAVKDVTYALREMAPAAGNVTNEIAAAKLALDIAATGLMDVHAASKLVRDLLEGDPKALNEVLKKLNIKATDAADALQKLHDKFGGETEKIAAETSQIDKLSQSIHNLWEQIAHGINIAIDPMERMKAEQARLKALLDESVEGMLKVEDKGSWAYRTLEARANDYAQKLKEISLAIGAAEQASKKAADDAQAGGKAGTGAPTPTGDPKNFKTPEQLAREAQEAINLQQTAVLKLEGAYKELAQAELGATEAALRQATTPQQITKAEADAVTQRKALLEQEVNTVIAEQNKELANAKLTDGERAQYREAAQVKIQGLEIKAAQDIDTIHNAAKTKLAAITVAEFAEQYAAARKGTEERINLAQKEADQIGKIFGLESKEYIKAQKDVGAAVREYQEKRLADELMMVNQKEAIDLADLKMSEEQIKEEYQAHAISIPQEIAALKSLEDQRYAIKRAALQKEAELEKLYGNDPAKIAKAYMQIEALDRTHQAHLTQIDRTGLSQREQYWKQFENTISSSFASAISGMIKGTMTWADAWKSVLSAMLDQAIQMFATWITEKIAADIFGVTSSQTTASAEIAANAGVAATGAAASVAAIPYVGWAMAPGVAAATYAEMMAFQVMAKAEGGFDVPAYQSPITQLHPREMVLDQEDADTIRSLRGKRGLSRGGGDTHITIVAQDSRDVHRFMRQNAKAVVGAAHNAARRFVPGARAFS